MSETCEHWRECTDCFSSAAVEELETERDRLRTELKTLLQHLMDAGQSVEIAKATLSAERASPARRFDLLDRTLGELEEALRAINTALRPS